jgi:hypothetical protein
LFNETGELPSPVNLPESFGNSIKRCTVHLQFVDDLVFFLVGEQELNNSRDNAAEVCCVTAAMGCAKEEDSFGARKDIFEFVIVPSLSEGLWWNQESPVALQEHGSHL